MFRYQTFIRQNCGGANESKVGRHGLALISIQHPSIVTISGESGEKHIIPALLNIWNADVFHLHTHVLTHIYIQYRRSQYVCRRLTHTHIWAHIPHPRLPFSSPLSGCNWLNTSILGGKNTEGPLSACIDRRFSLSLPPRLLILITLLFTRLAGPSLRRLPFS